MRLFLSYAHADEERIRALTEAIAPFHRIWLDKLSIAPGQDWRSEIKRGIRRCDVFLFAASMNSCCSRECHWEVDYALKYGKRIIPVILEDCNLRSDLAKLQWIFAEESMNDAVRSLLKELQPQPPYFWMGLSILQAAVIVGLTIWN